MNASTILNIAALTLSLIALIVSAFLAVRQLGTMRQTNILPIVTSILQEPRSQQFREHLDYISHQLLNEYTPEAGCFELPEPARDHVLSVCYYYEGLGLLVRFGVIDERMAISAFGTYCDRAWRLLEPFILGERRARGSGRFQVYFEDLVCRVRATPPPLVDKHLNLRRVSPSLEDTQVDGDLAAKWHKSQADWYQEQVKHPSDRVSRES
jgi:hypothetical protein